MPENKSQVSKSKHLHIVSLDVPYPPDYGGVIDIYYRIQALHQLGYIITLHCFEYGRGKQDELEKITSQIYYYRRQKRIRDWLAGMPFIVKTRNTDELLRNLLLDEDPILFDGLHTTFLLSHEQLRSRVKFVRTHNIEHAYYQELARKTSGYKKLYYTLEALKLKRFEPVLKYADHILAIQWNDVDHFRKIHPSVHLLPASAPLWAAPHHTATKPYCLFHGNLAVAENEKAALWILHHIVSRMQNGRQFIIAGKHPSRMLSGECRKYGVTLIPDPCTQDMTKLLNEARVHVLYTDQPTGLKLKLLNALGTSGHVIVNEDLVAGSDLESLCQIASSPDEFRKLIERSLDEPLSPEEYTTRKEFLVANFDTEKNCHIFSKLLNSS